MTEESFVLPNILFPASVIAAVTFSRLVCFVYVGLRHGFASCI